ncbi:hypothetical protein L6452_42850 [Arctium lappa]|uniref:Uncharacterized protein n=1 Tax=Arctium lappa TaxID=4217 RepID=A0ACB8XJC9_ARCLA|nr:hypothetical protein L6452_42850 [Arctium lappa]
MNVLVQRSMGNDFEERVKISCRKGGSYENKKSSTFQFLLIAGVAYKGKLYDEEILDGELLAMPTDGDMLSWRDDDVIIPLEDVQLDEEISYAEKPVAFLDRKVKKIEEQRNSMGESSVAITQGSRSSLGS